MNRVFLLLCLLVATLVPCVASEADALAISARIQSIHMPYGTILDPIYNTSSSEQIRAYTRCGDSALWTGHYLAAEAYRYNVTKSPDALANVKNAMAGLKSLVDVTGNNLLARCIVPANSPSAASIQSEEAANGIHQASPWFWVGNTSRDQYSGVIFGLGVAYDLVDDASVKTSVSDLVTRLVAFLTGHNWSIIMPDGTSSASFLIRPDQMLALMQVARHVNPDRFSTSYDILRLSLSGTILAPVGVDVADDGSYFKFNLAYINLFNLIRLESSSFKDIYSKAYSILRNHTAGHQNAFFNMIDRGLNGANAARDTQTVQLLDQWLQRPRRDFYVDVSGKVPVCINQACQPIPVPLRVPTNFLWERSPFQLAGGGSGLIENPGIDYILPYWMGRYYGVIQPLTVQPAAAPGPSVAPDSIASIFGNDLSAQTTQAPGLPLPSTLGGVAVNVKDSAGLKRSAPLIFVSPTQINFVIPQGTAPGTATFTVAGGAASAVATASVQTVAPALFSMNGNGQGVAAATAIRTQAGNPQFQAPVSVFSCGASGCVPVPIDVGLDTPVFLTLYGTGIRNRSSLANVKVTINGIDVPVLYAGPQPEFPGLDQVNVGLTLSLRESGESNVIVTVDGQASNPVTVAIQ